MTALDPAQPLLEASHDAPVSAPAAALPQILAQSGLSPVDAALRYAKVCLGPGKLNFSDFVRLRLFDDAFVEGPLDEFIGLRRNLELCHVVNHRHDWFGLMANKIASRSYLAAYGLPTLPVAALYAPGLRAEAHAGAPQVLGDTAALEGFLRDPAAYPLFGKPVEGFQSLGSIALTGVSADGLTLQRVGGTGVALAEFVGEVVASYGEGYVLQPLMRPHPDIEVLCGPRLATVRVVTLLGEGGPEILGAAWKIPGGANTADNFWRPGNLLAQLDLATGAVKRVVTGSGFDLKPAEHHPDTGAAFAGVHHPDWRRLCDLALEGARLMRHVPLIGWDLAGLKDGPVVVEMNETPDVSLIQLAERKGFLTPAFAAVVERQRAAAKARHKQNQAAVAKL